MKKNKVNIFWFRRDLRLNDNPGLYHALKSGLPVLPLFIFDTIILNKLEDRADARVSFIHQALTQLSNELASFNSSLIIKHGSPKDVWLALQNEYSIENVFINHDYEPYAMLRDEEVKELLKQKNIELLDFKDQAIFEKNEVLKNDGKPYSVFTPYKNKWLKKLNDFYLRTYPSEKHLSYFFKTPKSPIPSLKALGFEQSFSEFPEKEYENIFANYDKHRNIPSIKGTSHISVHLRFGTVSIRELVRNAQERNAETWLNELIWRDFYFMIIWHFPHVIDRSFKPEYDQIKWRNNEEEFRLWCEGKTGYPIVDAGMRELNTTGFMHNRVRMITASFLTKHLLIDWRWGETYFAKKLLDFELSSNNGGWQWVAGSGCDAAPYFRIFNPHEQTKKFDPQLEYIKKWVPEFDQPNYPFPIVEHQYARQRCLMVYKLALKSLK
ncbi:deoxyribodipyrimidine photolyase [Solitalea longa]|uniref:Deoxyribodipyrimidine photolyase n=1 Tax=Solitalea longa TaxID=2079460 RepID=A0A2S5A0B3_9SPHI|nr:deoxyribodipyrimidine photo-lyase [Solitalea longa]POY35759.1 deoxyribodipyrimidine photolyase [Solitalea longa]